MATERARTQPRGVIFNVQRASFHDGPGIRTTVFFKGCPLRCPRCHNPEGVRHGVQVGFDEGRCLHCGACLDACPLTDGPLPPGALLGSAGCTACQACIAACPGGARRLLGRCVTVEDLLAEVGRDRPVFEASTGGVTFSGGPLAQADFLCACLKGCRRAGIHTAVDTCGAAGEDTVVAVASRTDLLLWDLKHLDPDRHLALTGMPLAPVLANLVAAAATGVAIWLRLPVLAGVNDDADHHIQAAARLAAATPGVERVSLLPYRSTGTGKLVRLGNRGGSESFAAPPQERLRVLAAVLAASGIETTIGG